METERRTTAEGWRGMKGQAYTVREPRKDSVFITEVLGGFKHEVNIFKMQL